MEHFVSLKGDALLLIFFTLNFIIYSSSHKVIRVVLRKGDNLIINKPSSVPKSIPHFIVDMKSSVYSDDGTVSIELDGFSTCFKSHSRTNLLVFIQSHDHFLETMRNMTQQASKIKTEKANRQSYCEVYMLNQTCQNSISGYKIEDFLPTTQTNVSNAKRFPFDMLSDIYLVQFCEADGCLKFWEIYSVKNTLFMRYIYQQKGVQDKDRDTLNLNLKDFAMNNKTKIMRRQDLNGLEVVASVFLIEGNENDNLYEVEVGVDGTTGEAIFLSGLSVSILRDFRSAMNFTEKLEKIHFGTDNYFVSAFTSGEHQFDINLFHTSVTKNRSAVAQPLHPTFFDGVHAVFVQPFDQSIRNIYQKPFALQMWHALVITWSSIFLSCKLVAYLQAKYIYKNENLQEKPPHYIHLRNNDQVEAEAEEEESLSTFEPGLWCIASICQQGWDRLPSSLSMRIIFVTSLVLSVVCYSAFTGKIVAELYYNPKSIKSIKSLFAYAKNVYLIESSDTSYDVLEGLAQGSPEILKKIKFLPLEKIYSKLIKNPGSSCVITWPDSVTSYVSETLGEKTLTESNVDAFICDTFSSFTYQSISSMFIPKNSEFGTVFNYRIIVGLQRGFIRRYWNIYKKQSYLSCLESRSKVTTLDFSHVFFAFFLLFGGMAISLALLISEMIISKGFSSKRN